MKKFWIRIALFILTMALAIGAYLCMRGHVILGTESVEFTESAKKLNNPERGFYRIYAFRIKDNEEDYKTLVKEKLGSNTDMRLSMIQINLQEYRDGDISEIGLKHIDELFETLEKYDRKYIVRFLYDWNGENMYYEPASINIILKHMEQVGTIINRYQHIVYVMQGLFTGNCGEMNSTRYASQKDLNVLTNKLLSCTDIYLSVRTPEQWRMSLEIEKLSDAADLDRLQMGLFNDGIMGNEYDYGTYSVEGTKHSGIYGMEDRESELEFQSELCRYAPNGGEVIIENPFNDFENARDTLRKMRISYLNIDYDRKVLDKWDRYIVEDDSVYDGMSGLEYIERHMGYRFLISGTHLDFDLVRDKLDVSIKMKNVGFAPVYYEKKLILTVCNKEGEVVYTSEFEQDLRSLYGGEDADDELELKQEISVFGWDSTEYDVYFCIQDEHSKEKILLANEQKIEHYGYKIGTVTGGIK